mgnify:CR=1 FL=1
MRDEACINLETVEKFRKIKTRSTTENPVQVEKSMYKLTELKESLVKQKNQKLKGETN